MSITLPGCLPITDIQPLSASRFQAIKYARGFPETDDPDDQILTVRVTIPGKRAVSLRTYSAQKIARTPNNRTRAVEAAHGASSGVSGPCRPAGAGPLQPPPTVERLFAGAMDPVPERTDPDVMLWTAPPPARECHECGRC